MAITDQADAGLAVLTDGEQDRVSYQEYFLRRMDGLRYEGDSPIANVVGPLSLPAPVAVEAVAPMRALTDLPIKLSVVGPFTLSNRMTDAYYHDRDKLGGALADAVNGELRALEAAGCDYLQIDEPGFTSGSRDLAAVEWGISLLDRALEGITKPVVMHMCFGYAFVVKEKTAGRADSSYHAVLPLLRNQRPDILSLELAQPKADLSILALCPEKSFLLGMLDLSSNDVEAPEAIAARIEEAARYAPIDHLFVGPDCGMKFLPMDVARGKLHALTVGAGIARQRLG
jgi:5-methyltetrahydropteroyltriglutamate--homocysteine methyltransferase